METRQAVEGAGDAGEEDDPVDGRHLRRQGPRQGPPGEEQEERGAEGQAQGGGHAEPQAVQPVRGMTAEERHGQEGQRLREAHQAQGQRIARAVIDLPAHHHTLHLEAQGHQPHGGDEPAIVRVPQDRIGIECCRFRLIHFDANPYS